METQVLSSIYSNDSNSLIFHRNPSWFLPTIVKEDGTRFPANYERSGPLFGY